MAEVQTHGTVTAISPSLRVVCDGATVDSPAMALNGATYVIGNRVTITVRNPLIPLVLGIEA
jgi:hypothetical protein